MNHLKGLGYNAVGTEHAFAAFMQQRIGARGLPHDADVFRSGDICALGEVIEHFADHFQQRAAGIQWASTADGTPGARVQAAIQSLRSLATRMKASRAKEPEDYHWLIVADLVLVTAALLEHIGA